MPTIVKMKGRAKWMAKKVTAEILPEPVPEQVVEYEIVAGHFYLAMVTSHGTMVIVRATGDTVSSRPAFEVSEGRLPVGPVGLVLVADLGEARP